MKASAPILALERVCKRFGGLSVLEDLSFIVERGSRTALIGPNGAGKTSVFNLMTGLYSLDSGRILLDGVDIGALPVRLRIRHGIARTFQNIRLMRHLSALENVMIGQHASNSSLLGVLQPINLVPRNHWREEARRALADVGLSTCERATAGALPYGTQRRIELARALIAEPRLLLLDEPAAGLNPQETENLRAYLEAVCTNRGITLLVVEHDMHFVGALCQRVIALNFGRKIAEGTPEQVRAHPLVREAYLGAETSTVNEPFHAT
jgi:branched-chain amino acid transport system ATP-binding protein